MVVVYYSSELYSLFQRVDGTLVETPVELVAEARVVDVFPSIPSFSSWCSYSTIDSYGSSFLLYTHFSTLDSYGSLCDVCPP